MRVHREIDFVGVSFVEMLSALSIINGVLSHLNKIFDHASNIKLKFVWSGRRIKIILDSYSPHHDPEIANRSYDLIDGSNNVPDGCGEWLWARILVVLLENHILAAGRYSSKSCEIPKDQLIEIVLQREVS